MVWTSLTIIYQTQIDVGLGNFLYGFYWLARCVICVKWPVSLAEFFGLMF